MTEKSEFGVGKFFAMLISAVLLVFLSVVATLLIVRSMQPPQLCGFVQEKAHKPLFGEQEQWVGVNRIEIPGKDVEVVRTEEDLCYVQPKPLKDMNGKARPMKIIREPLSQQMLEELASPAAVEFCDGATAYLLKEVVPEELEHARQKRQETDISYVDQRTPRCEDIILDCVASVGQKSTCNTGVNGVFFMERTCESETKFKIFMTKPPGRILKVLQQESKVCRIRRLKGLRC
jgi:hypothetical protein